MAVRNSVHLEAFVPKSDKFIINYKPNEEEPNRSIWSSAVNVRRDFKNKEGTYDYDLIQCTAFGPTAKYLGTYATHGSRLLIEGEIRRGNDYEKDGELVRGQLYVHITSVSASTPEGTGESNTASQETKVETKSPMKKSLFSKK